MLVAPQERSCPRKKTGLNRWKQLTRKLNAEPAFDPNSVEHWMKRVEKASEFALSKTFPAGNSDFSRRPWEKAIDLEAFEQIEDHDEIYAEAQELVNDWLNTKLKQELASDGEGDTEDTVSSFPPVPEVNDHLKYNKFDDLCDYLEEEEESTTVQKFIDHLLHKDVVDSRMLEDLGVKRNQDKKQQKDPRLTMEMRHKQVKENRLRREKELERRRIEKTLKKSAFLEAQSLVQEEKKRKVLEAKKEEEEIQREMVKLRREIIERKHTVEEAWKTEKKRLEENSSQHPEKSMFQSSRVLGEEKIMAKEKKKKLKALLIQTFKEDHQCQKRYFSAWHKLILDDRIKLGKAGTLSDWKFQLKVLRAWRDYTRSRKLERETQAMEHDLREENRKQQLATEYNRKQVLRHHFTEWQHWHRAEILKREMILAKKETRRKINELLAAASQGKLGAKQSSGITELEEATTMVDTSGRNGEQLIEKQKKKLQEQQKTILELKESQKLAEARWAMEHATIVDAQNRLLLNLKEEPKRTCHMLPNSSIASSGAEGSRSDSRNCLSETRRNPRQLVAPHPILKAMEERAVQRAERRRILAERKKKQEEEKLAQLKAQEEERQKREAEEKEAQIKKRQEEKRLKKMKELEKEKRIKRNQQLDAIAKEHYERILLRKKGLEPWRRLRLQSKQNMQVAKEHHSLTLKKKCLLTWFQCSQESLARKTAQADQFYSQILLRKVIGSWLQYLTDLEEEVQKFHVHFLQKKIFRAWLNIVRKDKTDLQSKQEIAVEHSNRRIIWIAFQTWKAFVKFMKEERVKEERREILRRKVAEILPDFQKLAPP
ncbi:coiled-coil domain-containing protein 191 isoform X4 [Erinaceus europaeus]|uniref:Coiled-coil domain-containing protein 191 isoform X4 n=1 Tax=Erinaceus europaeus TaxID=9365 RepID=A0ABM3XZS7_ERIEU|nr:coiled-coil domain-containing protein 191 isoform X4 [Erinaceus europaeus]